MVGRKSIQFFGWLVAVHWGMANPEGLAVAELSEEMEDEEAGETNIGKWVEVISRKGKRKKRTNSGNSSSDGLDSGEENRSENIRQQEEIKVKLQFDSPSSLNPLKISKALHDAVGSVSVKPLRDGNVIITCVDSRQKDLLVKMTTLEGKKIKCVLWERKRIVQGVITGVSTELTNEEIMRNVTGARVERVKRLTYNKDGVKKESLSILLSMREERLPTRIRVGYMSYQVREYIPPPLRCFKCQKFGHVAAICRGKARCGKCGGEDHEYGKCEQGTKVRCCNCGGEHSAAYKGCDAHKRAAEVQRIKVEEKVTYAEAIKQVKAKKETAIPSGAGPGIPGQKQHWHSQGIKQIGRDANTTYIAVENVKFVAFLAEVINCSAQTSSKTERIKIIIRAAQKYIGMGEITIESINDILLAEVGLEESQTK